MHHTENRPLAWLSHMPPCAGMSRTPYVCICVYDSKHDVTSILNQNNHSSMCSARDNQTARRHKKKDIQKMQHAVPFRWQCQRQQRDRSHSENGSWSVLRRFCPWDILELHGLSSEARLPPILARFKQSVSATHSRSLGASRITANHYKIIYAICKCFRYYCCLCPIVCSRVCTHFRWQANFSS